MRGRWLRPGPQCSPSQTIAELGGRAASQRDAIAADIWSSPESTTWIPTRVETGNLTIQVVEAAKIGRRFEPSSGGITLHVEDVEAARRELESRAVEFEDETIDSGACHTAFFCDPTGTP
ncbi:MAG: hypothetical protein M3327_03710 [Actinomycetota bacterium]|nr:hypothetical protein [Actinomycetota bacterium]